MWVIRHPNLQFERPMPEAELIAMIEAGEVSGQDEIAPGNGYWFTIQEVAEVKKHFGDTILLKSIIPTGADTTSSTITALLGATPGKLKAESFLPKAAFEPAKHFRAKSALPVDERDVHSRARIVFGLFLILIFLGTLSLLWLGSK
jgi:hypothetical protein